jgi:hypothetical protein
VAAALRNTFGQSLALAPHRTNESQTQRNNFGIHSRLFTALPQNRNFLHPAFGERYNGSNANFLRKKTLFKTNQTIRRAMPTGFPHG